MYKVSARHLANNQKSGPPCRGKAGPLYSMGTWPLMAKYIIGLSAFEYRCLHILFRRWWKDSVSYHEVGLGVLGHSIIIRKGTGFEWIEMVGQVSRMHAN